MLTECHQIIRHGDRAPGELPFPLDSHNESEWPREWDSLTSISIIVKLLIDY